MGLRPETVKIVFPLLTVLSLASSLFKTGVIVPHGAWRWLTHGDQWPMTRQKHFPWLHFNLDCATFSYILRMKQKKGGKDSGLRRMEESLSVGQHMDSPPHAWRVFHTLTSLIIDIQWANIDWVPKTVKTMYELHHLWCEIQKEWPGEKDGPLLSPIGKELKL